MSSGEASFANQASPPHQDDPTGVEQGHHDDDDGDDDELDAPIDVFDDEYRLQFKDVELNQRMQDLEEFSKQAHDWHQQTERRVHTSILQRRRAQRKKLGLVMAAIVATLVLFIVVVVRGGNRKNSSSSSASTPVPTMVDCGGSVQIETSSLAYRDLVSYLSPITPTSVFDDDPCSIQSRAVQWLLDEDYTDDGLLLQERYAVVVLDLALGAHLVRPNVSTCDWSGITCATHHPTRAVASLNWAHRTLTGRLPDEVRALSNQLTVLDLAENEIMGSLPDGLWDCTRLEKLYLHDNALTGTLPERLANLDRLQHLYLSMNQFVGPFPQGLGTAPNATNARPLTYLSLYDNDLTGTIPAHLDYRFMFYLDLSHNHFNGSLPVDWSQGSTRMLHLRHLFLNDNALSGSIPDSYPTGLGNGRLELFHVGNNRLTGTVPGGYEPRTFLDSLEVQGNNFTALAQDICSLIIFLPPASELANLKVDCAICNCSMWCEPGYCNP